MTSRAPGVRLLDRACGYTVCLWLPQDVVGSSAVFYALLQRLAAQDKVAICRFIPRDEGAAHIVSLLPQLERLDAKNVQVAPPGFHLIYLPFSDDLRKLPHQQGTPGTRCA